MRLRAAERTEGASAVHHASASESLRQGESTDGENLKVSCRVLSGSRRLYDVVELRFGWPQTRPWSANAVITLWKISSQKYPDVMHKPRRNKHVAGAMMNGRSADSWCSSTTHRKSRCSSSLHTETWRRFEGMAASEIWYMNYAVWKEKLASFAETIRWERGQSRARATDTLRYRWGAIVQNTSIPISEVSVLALNSRFKIHSQKLQQPETEPFIDWPFDIVIWLTGTNVRKVHGKHAHLKFSNVDVLSLPLVWITSRTWQESWDLAHALSKDLMPVWEVLIPRVGQTVLKYKR